jgi:DNA-directed RNA polymerase specialized sigma24 family protein
MSASRSILSIMTPRANLGRDTQTADSEVHQPSLRQTRAPAIALLADRERQAAARVVDRNYEPMKPGVVRAMRSRLCRFRVPLHGLDLEEFYNDAWEVVHEKLSRGESIDEPEGFLVVVGCNKAIDYVRKTKPRWRAVWPRVEEIGVEHDIAARLDNRMRLDDFEEAMREALTNREYALMRLCLFCGLTRPEAARQLGETPERTEKIMDGAWVKLRPLVRAIERGEWCAMRASRLRAMACGVIDDQGERYAAADIHLKRCPACRATLRAMRARRMGDAA